MLGVLFAIFALAVGLPGFGNVDLWEVVSCIKIHADPAQQESQEFVAATQQPLLGCEALRKADFLAGGFPQPATPISIS